MMKHILVIFLICQIPPVAQAQATCLPLEYRITINKDSDIAEKNFNVNLHFYNPNSESYILSLLMYYLDLVVLDSELVNKNVSAANNYFITYGLSTWRFLPGVATLSVPIRVSIIGFQDSVDNFLPDGNYTLSYYYSRVSGYPLTLQIKSGKIVDMIAIEPTWNYDTEGGVKRVDVSSNSGCETPVHIILLLTVPPILIILVVIAILVRKRNKGKYNNLP